MKAPDSVPFEHIPLFRGLCPADVAEVRDGLRCRIVPLGTVIAREDEPGEAIFVIGAGFVRIQVDQTDGTSTILAILGPTEVVGEMSVADHLGRSATVVAHEPAALYWMSRAVFWAYLRRMPVLAYNLAAVLSRRLRRANEQIEALATLGVEGRVARQLLVSIEEYGEVVEGGVRIPFRLSQSDVAGLVGASRVRVNQILVDYRRRGYVSTDVRGRFVVHDRARLADRCRRGGPVGGSSIRWEPWDDGARKADGV